ncbi:MAG: hypothetical protein K9J82_17785 [Methylotenera sp.]|jgi:hypothetical protein|nr:hypothetical protein [Methylotenera sp.]
MTLHKLTVTLLLAATLALALGYVSTFPSEAADGSEPDAAGWLESDDIADPPAPGATTPVSPAPPDLRRASANAWA